VKFFYIKISQTVCEISRFFIIFKIAAVHQLGFVLGIFGPPTKEYMMVFIVMQNLVVVDAAVSLMQKF